MTYDRERALDDVRAYFEAEGIDTSPWPDDDDLRDEIVRRWCAYFKVKAAS